MLENNNLSLRTKVGACKRWNIIYFSGVNTAKRGKDDELLTTMVGCSIVLVCSAQFIRSWSSHHFNDFFTFYASHKKELSFVYGH